MDKIREILAEMGMKFRLDSAVVDMLEELSKRVYALEEDNKLTKSAKLSLEKRYAELAYLYKDSQKQIRELESRLDTKR